MYHMEVNDVMEHEFQESAWVSVDGSKRAAEIRPTLRCVFGQRRGCVVEIGDHNYQ